MPKAPKAPAGKATKLVHPNSRKASFLQKQLNRDERVMKSKAETTLKQDQLQEKLLWFQEHLDPQKTTYTKHELAELTAEYLGRFEEQLEQISIVNSVGNRKNNQHIARESAIRITKEKELHDFNTVGIEVPDLINGKAFEQFRNWTGEAKYQCNIKLRRSKKVDIKEDVSAKGKEAEELPDFVESDGDEEKEEPEDKTGELPDFVETD